MLDTTIIKNIESFVNIKPRSIQEIAEHLNKNWRTTERYLEKIEQEFGTISTRIFRKGTRGALKIIYATPIDKISSTVFQEELEKQIFAGRTKEDFSALDIYQFVTKEKKFLQSYYGKDENSVGRMKEFSELLLTAKKQVLFFSGNLSFINFDDGTTKLFNILETLVKKGISIKVISRIHLSGKDNVQKLLSLNNKYGQGSIEIRYRNQPLRATIIDNNYLSIKEILEPSARTTELRKRMFIFYTIKDKEWIEWLTRIFHKMFNGSIGSEKRLRELESLR